jgi:hypothetical protein
MRQYGVRWRASRLTWPVFLGLSLVTHGAAVLSTRLRPPATEVRVAFEPPEQASAIAGETLDIDPADPAEVPPDSPAAPPEVPITSLPIARFSPRTPGATPSSPSRSAPATLFGAVGERSAVDLATTFTRAFPQAASADPLWLGAAFGSTSSAEVTLALDEDGHLSGSTVAGGPSSALRHGIERTLALLGARSFTARSAATKLRITAHVSRDDVHDGLHGDVFALSGGSFAGDVGSAFFALPAGPGAGRRVDVELRLLP